MRNIFALILAALGIYVCYKAVTTNDVAWCIIFAIVESWIVFLKTVELEDALKDHERRLGHTQAVIMAMLTALGLRIEDGEDSE